MSVSARYALTFVALLTGLLLNVGAVAQQNPNGPTPPAEQAFGGSINAGDGKNEVPASARNLIDVPLVALTPGAIELPKVKSPVGNDSTAVQRGMRYFNNFNCVGCHAVNGGGGQGIALSNSDFKFGSDPAQIYSVISHGAPLGMPAWGTVLPDNVIWDIVAYIQSISKAPSGSWGTTVNAAERMPAVEQVPAEFQNTSSPWDHTQPFSNGSKPTNHALTSSGEGAQPPKAQ